MTTFAVPADAWHELVDAVVDASEIDGDGLVEILRLGGEQRCERADAGVVRHQMDHAEFCLDFIGCRLHRGTVDDVYLDGVHAVLAGPEAVERWADLVVADIADDH